MRQEVRFRVHGALLTRWAGAALHSRRRTLRRRHTCIHRCRVHAYRQHLQRQLGAHHDARGAAARKEQQLRRLGVVAEGLGACHDKELAARRGRGHGTTHVVRGEVHHGEVKPLGALRDVACQAP